MRNQNSALQLRISHLGNHVLKNNVGNKVLKDNVLGNNVEERRFSAAYEL